VAAPHAPSAAPRPGLSAGVALLLLSLGLLLNVSRLSGPLRDGQAGNCGAMFAIFERNAQALGLLATHAVPVLDPVPPSSPAEAEFYAHHPPGLPWLVMLAGRLPLPIETASRLVALLAFLLATLLVADLAARLAGGGAALAAGVLMLALPAGRHDATLVNYETVALPALLLLLRSLRLGLGRPWVAAVLAALADWVALLPLLGGPGAAGARAWRRAVLVAAAVIAGFLWLVRGVEPAAGSGTLSQAFATTFLARDFDAGAWLAALRAHLAALYGWALLPAALALLTLPRQPAPRRGVLLWLLGAGVFNVVAFARHATGHEHFALLLLPWVALSIAMLLFPGPPAAGPARGLALSLMVVLLAAATWQFEGAAAARARTDQSELGDAFAQSAPTQALYVRPGGAPLVFLFRAQRHVAPQAADTLAAAQQAAEGWRERCGLPDDWPAWLVLAPGDEVPEWAASLGPMRPAGAFRLLPLPR